MVDIRYIKISELKDTASVLFSDHYEDDHRKAKSQLDIDWSMYDNLYDAGVMKTLGAFVEDQLVGYLLFYITPSFHNKGSSVCMMDSLFVAEEYRSKGIARKFLEEMEKFSKENNISTMTCTFRDEESANSTVVKAGFTKNEIVYSKDIGDN